MEDAMKTGILLVDWWNDGFSPEAAFLLWGSVFLWWKFEVTVALFFSLFTEYFWWMPFGLWAILTVGIFLWFQIRK